MLAKYSFAFIALITSCKSYQIRTSDYECVLNNIDFDESSYMKQNVDKIAYTNFCNNIKKGFFYTNQSYNQSNLIVAMTLDSDKNILTTYRISSISEMHLNKRADLAADSLINHTEQGFFRQVCYSGPSEGSLTVFLVKKSNKTFVKYESSQCDYSCLRKSEQNKLKILSEFIRLAGMNK